MSTSFPILDLVIGLIFIFFLLSVITSSAVELVLSFAKLRAHELEEWLYKVLDKPALNADGLYYDQSGTTYKKTAEGEFVATTIGQEQSPQKSLIAPPALKYEQSGARAYNLTRATTSPVMMQAPDSGAGAKGAEVATPKEIKLVSLGQSIMDHCTATVLSGKGKAPTYIDARNFVSALLEKITLNPADPGSIPATIDDFKKAIEASPIISHELKRTILSFANEAIDEATKSGTALINFRTKLEGWYDATTDRISGALKRKWALPFTIVLAAATTVGLNADTVALSKFLYTNKEARAALANTAQTAIDTAQYDTAVVRINRQLNGALQANKEDTSWKDGLKKIQAASAQLHNSIAELEAKMPQGLPLGPDRGASETIASYSRRHFLGWLFTLVAICLGAPFWFDLLNKVANLRGTGPKPASATDAERKLMGTDKK